MIQAGRRQAFPATFEGERRVHRVYLFEACRMVRAALRRVIRDAGGFDVVGEGAALELALEDAPRLAPDIIVFDPFDDRDIGVGGLARLSMHLPSSSILVATAEEERAVNELRVGGSIRALVSKDGESADLVRGLRAAGDGAWFVCPRIARRGGPRF